MLTEKESFGQFVAGSQTASPPQRKTRKVELKPATEVESQAALATTTNIQQIADKLVARLADDLTVAPPRSGDDDGRAVTVWMERHRERFIDLLEELLTEAPGFAANAESGGRRLQNPRASAENVFPEVTTELRRFALGRTALRWGARFYPNFVEFGRPEFAADERHWTVPLEYARVHRSIGQITLDDEGNVIDAKTTTRQEAREALMHAA